MRWRQRSEPIETKPIKQAVFPFCCKPLLELKLVLWRAHCVCVCVVFPVRVGGRELLTHFHNLPFSVVLVGLGLLFAFVAPLPSTPAACQAEGRLSEKEQPASRALGGRQP